MNLSRGKLFQPTGKRRKVTIGQMGSDFPRWLQNELNARNWRPADLAKKTGLADAVISRVLRGQRTPQTETLRLIAKALRIPVENVFRAAGELPSEKQTDDWAEQKAYQLSKLDPRLRRIAETLIDGLVEQQEQEDRDNSRTRGKTKPV